MAQSVTVDGITYKVKNGEAYASKMEKDVEVAIIRSEVTINGKIYPVTALGRPWQGVSVFSNLRNLKSVSIPNSVRTFYYSAFADCSKLTELVLPDNPVKTSPSFYPFIGCHSLTNVRCQNGSIPTYMLDHLPEDCPFMLAQRYPQAGNNNNGYAQNVQPSAQKTSPEVAPVPKHPISDVDNLPTASRTDNENTFAVIFANEHYRREAAVEYAQNDGQMFKKYCESLLGLPSRNIHYVEDATLNDFQAELDWLSKVGKAYGKDANIIVYYAGHGIPDEQGNHAYLLPTDGIGDNVNTGYSLNRLYALLSELEAQKITVFLDACFSGSKRGEGMLASARGVAIKTKSESPKGNLIVFSAATSDETAYPFEENGHGLFTYFLLKKLKETSGRCSLGELSDYLTTQVTRHSIVVNSKSQTPCITASPALQSTWRNLKLK